MAATEKTACAGSAENRFNENQTIGGKIMFDKLVESATVRRNKGRWPYFTATAAIWMMALAMIVATGIFAYDARLSETYEAIVITQPPPPAPPPDPVSVEPSGRSNPQPSQPVQPTQIVPDGITSPSRDKPQPPASDMNWADGSSGPGLYPESDGGITGGNPIGVSGSGNPVTPPPPPEPKKQPKEEPSQTAVPRRSVMLQGTAIRRVEPSYPRLAIQVGASGAVVVEVTIDEKGDVIAARALSGHPLLREVSIQAARGWKWKPTILNGVPVKVIGTITFIFKR